MATSGYSQHYKYRHTKGSNAIDLNLGKTRYGKSVEIGVINFTSSNQQQLLNITTDFGKIETTDYFRISTEYSRQFTVYDINKKFYLNIFTGGSLGFESLKNDLIDEKSSGFVPGVLGGLEIESYINNKIAVLAKFKQQYHFNTDFSEFTYHLQLGCRCFF
jgi:hypothetical protein